MKIRHSATAPERCDAREISVIIVMSSGKHDGKYQSLDSKFRWDLAKTQEGIDRYLRAQTAYINEYKAHDNIIMFELSNEPYSEMTWSPGAEASGITKDEMYNFLKQSYDNAKTLTGAYVGISEYEEKEQAKYHSFSDNNNRKKYIDPCTDIYSMHIYRPDASYLADFSELTNKPKWISEIGNLNYLDPHKVGHPMAGCNELYDEEKNFDAVVSISEKAFKTGFSCVYLWSWGSNNGMVAHNSDGSHTIGKLLRWVQEQIST